MLHYVLHDRVKGLGNICVRRRARLKEAHVELVRDLFPPRRLNLGGSKGCKQTRNTGAEREETSAKHTPACQAGPLCCQSISFACQDWSVG